MPAPVGKSSIVFYPRPARASAEPVASIDARRIRTSPVGICNLVPPGSSATSVADATTAAGADAATAVAVDITFQPVSPRPVILLRHQ